MIIPPMFSPGKYRDSPALGAEPRERHILGFFKGGWGGVPLALPLSVPAFGAVWGEPRRRHILGFFEGGWGGVPPPLPRPFACPVSAEPPPLLLLREPGGGMSWGFQTLEARAPVASFCAPVFAAEAARRTGCPWPLVHPFAGEWGLA